MFWRIDARHNAKFQEVLPNFKEIKKTISKCRELKSKEKAQANMSTFAICFLGLFSPFSLIHQSFEDI